MVRLKAKGGGTIDLNNIYFNSTMVRLKAEKGVFNVSLKKHFNSTMVRLKAGFRITEGFHKNISIPQWYD